MGLRGGKALCRTRSLSVCSKGPTFLSVHAPLGTGRIGRQLHASQSGAKEQGLLRHESLCDAALQLSLASPSLAGKPWIFKLKPLGTLGAEHSETSQNPSLDPTAGQLHPRGPQPEAAEARNSKV